MFEHDFKRFPELTNQQLETLAFVSPHVQIVSDFEAIVEKVHDGDTVTLSCSFRDFLFPLRLANIDAPEMNAGGETAKQWLETRLLKKRVLVLVDHKNRVGRYGRLIGQILENGLSVGEELLRLGLVTTFENKREAQIPPTDKIFNLRQWF